MTALGSTRVYVFSRDLDESLALRTALQSGNVEPVVFDFHDDPARQLDSLPAGCVVVDMPAMDSPELALLRMIRTRRPDLAVVLVSRDQFLMETLDVLAAGGFEVVPGGPDATGLKQAVERALAGPELSTADVLEQMRKQEALEALSPRETDVLKLLLGGKQNKAIAHELGISPRTVEVHRARMMRRLGVTSFAELIRLAVEAGLRSKVVDRES